MILTRRLAALTAAGLTALLCLAGPPQLINLQEGYTLSADASSPAGIWRFGADGAIFEIKPTPGTNGSYTLLLLDSPDLSRAAGTLFGSMTATGKPGTYDVALRLNPTGALRGSGRPKTRNFIFEISPEGSSLTMRSYRKGKTVNLLRWLPYLFRISVSEVDTRPSGIDGATRIAPPSIKYPVTL